MTAAQITAFAIQILKSRGYRVRRVNNVGAYKQRRNQVEPGWPDIQGYCTHTGRVVLCEVKTENDRISKEQSSLLSDCKKAGGLAFTATYKNNTFNISEWQP